MKRAFSEKIILCNLAAQSATLRDDNSNKKKKEREVYLQQCPNDCSSISSINPIDVLLRFSRAQSSSITGTFDRTASNMHKALTHTTGPHRQPAVRRADHLFSSRHPCCPTVPADPRSGSVLETQKSRCVNFTSNVTNLKQRNKQEKATKRNGDCFLNLELFQMK